MLVKFNTFNMTATVNNNTISLLNIKDSEGNCIGSTFTNMIREAVLKLSNRILKAFSNNIEVLDLNTEEIIKAEKEIKVIPVIKTMNELENLIHDLTVNNKEYDLNNLQFRTGNFTVYKKCDSTLKEDRKGYYIIEKTYNTEDSDKKIIITYKVKHIKSKDIFKFVCTEKIEVR